MLKEVLVGSRVYTIQTAPGVFMNGQQVQAMVDYEVGNIVVDSTLNEKFQPHALVHEITHGILAAGCWNDENDNEKLVDYIAEHIVLLIRQNPHLVKYIQRSGEIDMSDEELGDEKNDDK